MSGAGREEKERPKYTKTIENLSFFKLEKINNNNRKNYWGRKIRKSTHDFKEVPGKRFAKRLL